MKKITTIIMMMICFIFETNAQKIQPGYEQRSIEVTDDIICPRSEKNVPFHVPPPEAYEWRKNGKTDGGATINVTYIGFSTQAQVAFQKAVDIWAATLNSPVTINIEANWKALGASVLGSASPTTFFTNFSGATKVNTWYPVALAEKLARKNLNGTNPDIRANFSSQAQWYYGTDGNTPSGKYDLVTVVLHELGHGLGFYSGSSVTSTDGTMRLSGLPIIFDWYLENFTGQSLLDQTKFPDPSASIRSALLSPLYFNSPILYDKNGLQRAILYSPSTYESGSSTSHFDQSTYSGTLNALMCPQLPSATAIQNPGLLMSSLFDDIGWKNTYLLPDTVKSTESVPANFTVKTIVLSDATPDFSTLKLYYSSDNFATSNSLTMTATGQPNEYTATFPSAGSGKTMAYYVTIKDDTKRFYFAPTEASAKSNYFTFFVGTDNVPPVVTHTQVPYIFLPTDTASLSATATDIFGIADVKIEYFINGVAQTGFSLTKSGSSNTYTGKFSFPSGTVKGGDAITYRVVARDNSIAKNTTYSPSTGYYSFNIEAVKPAQASYKNDFNSPSSDFVGANFSITTPSGFSNPAIHSEHPYKNGSGPNNESNYTYQLKIPIIVAATNALIKFDEIVLVEPGTTGSTFGSANFYDYVVVDGSKDGINWTPVEDGYDSRASADWLTAWNNGTGGGENSSTVGTPAMFKTRYLDLKKKFATNDNVQLRFRLFADAGAYGWGWAIDNLQIQGDVALVTGIDQLQINESLGIYPNPTDKIFTIEGTLAQPARKMTISVQNAYGELILQEEFEPNSANISQKINLQVASAGLYIVKINVDGNTHSKKLLVVK